MTLVNIALRPEQKTALSQRAAAEGTSFPEQVRRAVDAYLSGANTYALQLLNRESLRITTALDDMAASLRATNQRSERIFCERDRLRRAAQSFHP